MPAGTGDSDSLADLLQTGLGNVANGVPDVLSFLKTTAPRGQPPYMLARKLMPEYTCYITCSELGIKIAAPLPPDFDWSTEARYDTPMREVADDAVAAAGMVGSIGRAAMRASGLSFVTQALTAKFWSGSATGAISLPLILQAETNEINDVLLPFIQLKSLSLPRLSSGKRGGLLEAPGPSFDLARTYNAFKNSTGANSTGSSSVAGVQSNVNLKDALGNIEGSLRSGISGLFDAGKDYGVQGIWDKISSGISNAAETVDSIARQGVKNRISLQIGKYIFLDSVVITNIQHKHILQMVGGDYGQSSGNVQRIEINVTFEPFMDLTQQDLPSMFLDPNVASLAQEIVNRNRKDNAATDGFITNPFAGP